MASRQQQREAQRRDRHKKRREAASRARRLRANPSWDAAARWPWREAWVSESWSDDGALVSAFARRAHDDGRSAWLSVEVDLGSGEVVSMQAQHSAADDAQRELMRLSAKHTMVEVSPGTVAYVVEEACAHAMSPPRHEDDVRTLLGEVEPDDSEISLRFAEDAPTDPGLDAKPAAGAFSGFWARLLGRRKAE